VREISFSMAKKQKKPLSETHPELCKEWHPTKNGELKPKDVTPIEMYSLNYPL